MFILVLLYSDHKFQGIYRFATYYDFLNNMPKSYYCYKLYEDVGDGQLKCVKEKL